MQSSPSSRSPMRTYRTKIVQGLGSGIYLSPQSTNAPPPTVHVSSRTVKFQVPTPFRMIEYRTDTNRIARLASIFSGKVELLA